MVQTFRRKCLTILGQLKFPDLVFIDETGVELAMIRHFARATKRKLAYLWKMFQ